MPTTKRTMHGFRFERDGNGNYYRHEHTHMGVKMNLRLTWDDDDARTQYWRGYLDDQQVVEALGLSNTAGQLLFAAEQHAELHALPDQRRVVLTVDMTVGREMTDEDVRYYVHDAITDWRGQTFGQRDATGTPHPWDAALDSDQMTVKVV